MNLDTLQMETFLTVVREKNFRRAAKLLNVSQPTVTLRIKALEQNIGAQLINRSDNQITLTPAGQTVIKYIEKIIFVISEVKDHLSGISSSNNRYSIAAIPSFCTYAFPAILQEKNALAQTQFTIKNVTSMKVLQLVSDGAVEFGVMRGPFNSTLAENVEAKVLYDERIFLAQSKIQSENLDKEVTIEDVLKQNIITFERRFWSFFENRVLELGLNFNAELIVDSEITAKKLVAEGLGVTLLPEFSIRNSDDEFLSFKEIEDFKITRSAYLVYRKDTNEELVDKFYNWVQQSLNRRSKFNVFKQNETIK
ncbi:LysR family transcriptional regulator [Bacillus sp. Marseille-P3661]|uniref:LysR family transcriptional regulator n=1 Tax=Bacillus sp. Marseille-P3661 TaxID=1936234 RepID=UPI000C820180|nr:LysR family transcriptional regulator [Bacillus sp. Marseille-P3661]